MAKNLTSNKRSVLFWLLTVLPLFAAAGQDDKAYELTLPELIYESSEHFSDIETANLDGLLDRIGDARLVLLGESTHGTAEFYDMRARITRELIEKKGFTIVAVEADWPDATSIDHYIRGTGNKPQFSKKPFSGFPTWMWANHSVSAFVEWLKDYNRRFTSADDAVGFYGLDFYNIASSIEAVLNYLQDVDPWMAEVASRNYSCLMPWAHDPRSYSRVIESGRYHDCGFEVLSVLQDLLNNREFYRQADEQQFFNAEQNARIIRNAERYFRTLHYEDNYSWNQRDQNMFDTLQAILAYHDKTSKAVVWAHNIHVGDARATFSSAIGKFNLGQRVRETYGDSVYLVGFGTDHGTVAAATKWGGPMKVMRVQPSHAETYGRLFHVVKADNFLLPLRNPVKVLTRDKLMSERLQRAIGVTYYVEDELKKHHFYATLPRQFDEYIWFDETQAVKPLSREAVK